MDNVSPLKVNHTIRKKNGVVDISNELQSFGERDSIKSLICIGFNILIIHHALFSMRKHFCETKGKIIWEPITANNTEILKENIAKDDSRYPYSTIYIIQFGDPSVLYAGFFH